MLLIISADMSSSNDYEALLGAAENLARRHGDLTEFRCAIETIRGRLYEEANAETGSVSPGKSSSTDDDDKPPYTQSKMRPETPSPSSSSSNHPQLPPDANEADNEDLLPINDNEDGGNKIRIRSPSDTPILGNLSDDIAEAVGSQEKGGSSERKRRSPPDDEDDSIEQLEKTAKITHPASTGK